MAAQLYVYYRVRGEHLPAVLAALRQLQARWQAEDPALGCELMRRVDDQTGLETLMEVYRRADGITPAGKQRIEGEARAALSAWLVGERHVEVFAPCA